MAYSGFLLKIGNWEFPKKYIQADTYNVTLNMQDKEPWTDEDGYIHRNPVELKAIKVEFNTRNALTNTDMAFLMQQIKKNYVSEKGRTCYITAYVPETDDYVTQLAYLANFTPQMYLADDKKIMYDAVRLAFIGGVAND